MIHFVQALPLLTRPSVRVLKLARGGTSASAIVGSHYRRHKCEGNSGRADQFSTVGEISFNLEPTAAANVPRVIAVAVGSGLNERRTDWPWQSGARSRLGGFRDETGPSREHGSPFATLTTYERFEGRRTGSASFGRRRTGQTGGFDSPLPQRKLAWQPCHQEEVPTGGQEQMVRYESDPSESAEAPRF